MFSLWTSLNNFGKAIFLVFLSVLIIFLTEVRADRYLRQGLDIVVTPTAATFSRMSDNILGIGSFVGSIGRMGEENSLMMERIQLLEAENAQIEELRRENQSLREQLNLSEREGFGLVGARVVAREPLGGVKWITINRGTRDGVSERMPVVISEGLLVGYVEEVFDRSARIILLLEPTVEIPAMIQRSRTDGIVKGQSLGQGLTMELIPQQADVRRGNTVVTSGLGQNFPPGLVIGYVQTVTAQPNDIFQQADILSAVDFDRLEQVMVITRFDQ